MVAAGLCAVRFCRIAVGSKAGDVGSNPARTFNLFQMSGGYKIQDKIPADMAELADAPDLGSGGKP